MYFCRKVDGPPISCRVQLIILSFSFSAARSNLTNTQGTDVDGRCPLLSNSAQTPPISHFTTFEWSLQQFHTALHRVRGSPSICERSTALHRLSPLWVPVYEFEMVTKSQFHPRWATVMVLSGDCSNLKMQTTTFYFSFYCIMGVHTIHCIVLYLDTIQTWWNKMLLYTNGLTSPSPNSILHGSGLLMLVSPLSLSLWVICKVFPMLGESGFWRRWRITIARKHHFQLSRTFIAFDLQHIALMLMMMMMI